MAHNSVFPAFTDGDVHITITGSRQYTLHSTILKNCSPVMVQLLDEQWAAKLSAKAVKRGATIKHRLIMVDDNDDESSIAYVLEPVQVNDEGKAVTHHPIGLDLENGRVVSPTVLAYNSVLGAFYNIPIDLGDFENDDMAEILTRASNVLDVAEYLEAVHVVTNPIEATLLSTGQLIQRTIANNPAIWLQFAFRIRSRIIFREALIHAAGQYKTPPVQDNIGILDPVVATLLHKKGKALQEAMRFAEKKILSYYPTHLQREKTVGRADKDSIGRASYANDVMSWIALIVLRHFFAQALADDETNHSSDMGKELVDAVMHGGDAYLDKAMLEGFHTYFPMSPKGINVLEAKISEMKDFIKRFVLDLSINKSQLDVRANPIKHFTCTEVQLDEYPWHTGFGPTQAQRDESDDEEEEGDVQRAPEVDYDGDEESQA